MTGARDVVLAVQRGMLTPSEGVIMLADLLGVDARCAMGECYHDTAVLDEHRYEEGS